MSTVLKHKDIKITPLSLIGNNYFLEIPDMIDAFIDNENIFVFLCEDLSVYLYVFHFKNADFEAQKYMIGNDNMQGSVDNFGGCEVDIQKRKIESDYFFYVRYKRKVKMDYADCFFHYNLKSKKAHKILFEKHEIIKDEKKLFYTYSLDENENSVQEMIKDILNVQNEYFKYLGYLDDLNSYYSYTNSNCRGKGKIYFFYQDNPSGNEIKIIRYYNDNNEWILENYEEKEIIME